MSQTPAPVPVFDAHSDVFNDVAWRRAAGDRRVLATRHLPRLRAGGVTAMVMVVYVEPIYKPYNALPRALQILGAGLDDLAESPEAFRIVRQAADFDRAARAGQIAVVLGLEGAEPVEYSVESLRVFYEAGIRSLGLTWNQRNLLADGAAEIGTGGGLSALGERIVREANRLGVVIDVSHLAPAGVARVLEISDAPIAATHTNAATLQPHPRNLPDELLRAIAADGGVIGAVPVARFLSDDTATIDHLVGQIDYLIELVGARHVGLGPDFVDFLYGSDSPARHFFTGASNWEGVQGCNGWTDLPDLACRLADRGHSAATCRHVLHDNFRRLYREVLRRAVDCGPWTAEETPGIRDEGPNTVGRGLRLWLR